MAPMAPLTGRRTSWFVAGLLVCLLAGGALLVQSKSDVELPFPPANTDCRGDDWEVVHEVTLDALLHGPAKITCSGRWVRVKGFVVLEFEDHTLYESREAAERDRGEWNLFFAGQRTAPPPAVSLWVYGVTKRSTDLRFNQRNVIVTGRFERDPDPPRDRRAGEVLRAYSIDYQSVQDMTLPAPLVPVEVPHPAPPPR